MTSKTGILKGSLMWGKNIACKCKMFVAVS